MGRVVVLLACRIILTAPVQFQFWIGTFWTTGLDWIWDFGIGLELVNIIMNLATPISPSYSLFLVFLVFSSILLRLGVPSTYLASMAP